MDSDNTQQQPMADAQDETTETPVEEAEVVESTEEAPAEEAEEAAAE